MPRINPTVSEEAEAIYNKVSHFERGKFVSDAIIEKDQRSREQNKYITREEVQEMINKAIEERWGNK